MTDTPQTFKPGETAWCPKLGIVKLTKNPRATDFPLYGRHSFGGRVFTSQGRDADSISILKTLPQAEAYLEEQLAIVREAIAAQPKVLTPLAVARELAARAAKVDGFNETTEFIRAGLFDNDYSVRLLNEFITKHHNTPEQLAALLADGGE